MEMLVEAEKHCLRNNVINDRLREEYKISPEVIDLQLWELCHAGLLRGEEGIITCPYLVEISELEFETLVSNQEKDSQ